MIETIRVPEIGESIETGDVIKVLVGVGDQINVDQPLVELETDKAVVEIPSPLGGRVTEVLVAAGDTITIGQEILRVETSADTAGVQGRADKAEPKLEAASEIQTGAAAEAVPKAEGSPKSEVERKPRGAPTEAGAAGSQARQAASPAVRRLARELGVELSRVMGSGPGGRMSADDIKSFVRKALATTAKPGAQVRAEQPDADRWGPVRREALTKVRLITGARMTASWTTIPHVTQHDHADITGLESFRRSTSPRIEAVGGKLTVTAILLKVCATALKTFPRFNSSLDDAAQELVYRQYCHIGVAVDTERGLLVPVVRDADRKTLTELAVELTDLAVRTRAKKIKPDELEGGGFTISNLGGIGGTGFTPIVYAPQVAILGVSRTQREVRWVDGQPAERLILPLALSYDHRVIDGAEGARFLHWIADALENPYLAVFGA